MKHLEDEISLREIWLILKRRWQVLLAVPLIALTGALLYGFFIATPLYAATATVGAAPLQVQSQLEQKIQVQQTSPLPGFDGFRAVAFSDEVLQAVWAALNKEGKLPAAWREEGIQPGPERMARYLELKDRSPKGQALPAQGLLVEMRAKAPVPAIAAQAANLWASAAIKRVNELALVRLQASMAALDEQIVPANQTYREAQARWEAFNRTTRLSQDKAELEAKTLEQVNLDAERAGLERDLAAVAGRIAYLRAEMAKQARVVPSNASPDQMITLNQQLEGAKARLRQETERLRQAYTQAARALEDFQKRERTPQWNAELTAYTQAYAEAQARILALEVERSAKEARLRAVKEELSQVPSLLTLEREVGADPAVLAAVQGDGLQAVVGLKLRNQELNPTHQALLSQALGLQADLAFLAKERESLGQKIAALQANIARIKPQIAAQEREKEGLALEYTSKKAAYEALRNRLDQVAQLSALEVTFDNFNPEYQRLRSALIDAQAEEARLSARRATLVARIAQVDERIQVLKTRLTKAQMESDEVNQALELAKNTYLALVQKKTDLQIELASTQNSLIRVIAPAYPIYQPISPKRLLIVLGAVALGFLAALLWVFLAEAVRVEPRLEPGVSRGEA
ncbi:MAG: chain-length determining protein [Meiothermus ruber]|uniref:Wzz/FepE/Etk N-terminal domain-containing protein n=1 Tax=Meiothermus ruber TaxID=277 RepID=UPI0023F71C1F|nr:Wzz/FepE/Etk N-terminal domain-containing protein [Meiothermus ruber]MCL6529465.1 chain-length determining protein [Meiothermus ruber]